MNQADTDTSNKQFIRHAPCNNCGSKDNVSVYADGHAYCFGCKKYYKKYDGA